jgi:hypothetical protein
MERRIAEQSPADPGLPAHAAAIAGRRNRVAAWALRIICLAVCAGGLAASPAEAGSTRVKPGILAERADLDLKLQTALIDQPWWLRAAADEQVQDAGSLRLFLTARARPAPALESPDVRCLRTGLEAHELAFPVRKVAAEHLVTRSVMLKLSVGLDRELEQWNFGEITPSVGMQFERRFQ